MESSRPRCEPGNCVILDGESLTLAQVLAVARQGTGVRLDVDAAELPGEHTKWLTDQLES